MKCTKPRIMLVLALCVLFSSALQAQEATYSLDEIVGKWILKSANYNGNHIPMDLPGAQVSFEFKTDGSVLFISSEGKSEEGHFLIKDNKLIDPRVPEYPNADIISLSDEALILLMHEENNKVQMTFEADIK